MTTRTDVVSPWAVVFLVSIHEAGKKAAEVPESLAEELEAADLATRSSSEVCTPNRFGQERVAIRLTPDAEKVGRDLLEKFPELVARARAKVQAHDDAADGATMPTITAYRKN